MHKLVMFSFFSILLILVSSVCNAWGCSNPPKTLSVTHSGGGSFSTIQSAIDSIPKNNTQWTHIQISAGTYTEKVQIRVNKPCIFLEGAGRDSTIIQWSDHTTMSTSSTFSSVANDVIAKGITFTNTYNGPLDKKGNLPALAIRVDGDRVAFLDCGFKGVQDTLYDRSGRHYYRNCYIQGGIDFIFGNGQSIFEKCEINFTMGSDGPLGLPGFVTAQGRETIDEPTGFVFKECNITGNGKTLLGRAYKAFSRVIIYESNLSDAIEPQGWNAWGFLGHEEYLTYVEEGCTGAGANKSKRVPWLKHMDPNELNQFVSISYIDHEGWTSTLPTTSN